MLIAMVFPGSLEAGYTSGVCPDRASAFGTPAALLLAERMPAACRIDRATAAARD